MSTPSSRLRGEGRGEGQASLAEGLPRCGARTKSALSVPDHCSARIALSIGVVVFLGSGISANLADKAKKLGIPVMRFTETKAGVGAV